MSEKTGLIFQKIPAVMRKVGAIAKGRKNVQQGYQFRGIDDVYNEIHDALAEEGIFTVPRVVADKSEEKTSRGGTTLIYRILTIEYDFFASDGSVFMARVVGEGMDSGDKASNKAMAVAHKYALLQVFCIPTEESKDPENDSHELGKQKRQVNGKPESVPGCITLEMWNQIRAIVSKAPDPALAQKTILTHFGVKRPGEIQEAKFQEALDLAERMTVSA